MEQKELQEGIKELALQTKNGALQYYLLRIGGIINISAFTKEYLHKSAQWFYQRHRHHVVNGKHAEFKDEEFDVIVKALRHLGDELHRMADAIENAEH